MLQTGHVPRQTLSGGYRSRLRLGLVRGIVNRGGTGREFRWVPDPGIRLLLSGVIRVVAGSGYRYSIYE